ncbi:putative MRG domain containing protein [Blattamonas nauphoetae]|uniref:MRG domain containing protein n=1 Tax=Blattamonas nauphoetae TaxID=2049346 RepID=A0ABQ9XHR3_9EUKA|nr:putative MRG domain containing protein [Blattamonas nauphoetae]
MSETEFKIGQTVLAVSQNVYYRAQIKKIKDDAGVTKYFVHYYGWSSQWDEWIPATSIRPFTTETEKLIGVAAVAKKSEEQKTIEPKKKQEPVSESNSTLIRLQYPHSLYSVSVEDFTNVTKNRKLYSLPRTPTVATILETFRFTLSEHQALAMREFVKSLGDYFEVCLGRLLLTDEERPQYDFVMNLLNIRRNGEEKRADSLLLGLHPPTELDNTGKTPRLEEPTDPLSGSDQHQNSIIVQASCSIPEGATTVQDVYGGEHLLRLLFQLPSIISHSPALEDKTYRKAMTKMLQIFLNYIDRYRGYIFCKPTEDGAILTPLFIQFNSKLSPFMENVDIEKRSKAVDTNKLSPPQNDEKTEEPNEKG